MQAETVPRFHTLEKTLPAFFGMIAVLVLASQSQFPRPWATAGLFGLLLVSALLLHQVYRRGGEFAPLIAFVGGIGLLFATYSSLGAVIKWLLPEDREWFFLRIDRDWLGYDWDAWWAGLQGPWLTDFLQTVYAGFYVVPLLLGLALVRRRDWQGLTSALDRVILGFLISYLGYLLLPTRSPYEFLEYSAPLPSLGLQTFLHEEVVLLSWTQRDCFPSGHTMLTLYVAWLSWQRAREVFWILGPSAFLTVVATLYLRYHYLIDVIAGIAAFLVWIPVADRLFGNFRRQPASA